MEKPAAWDFTGSAKWSAWKKAGNITPVAAMTKYCDFLTTLSPLWNLDGPGSPTSPMTPGSPDIPGLRRGGGQSSPAGLLSPKSASQKVVGELIQGEDALPNDPLPLEDGLVWCDCDMDRSDDLDEAIIDYYHTWTYVL